jgi:hypothetical protein
LGGISIGNTGKNVIGPQREAYYRSVSGGISFVTNGKNIIGEYFVVWRE